MFSVSYGSENRERRIQEFFRDGEACTAVLLAAVHFEWTIKRAIMKLGISPTKNLRKRLERVWKLKETNDGNDYKSVWKDEVAVRFRNSSLGTVLGTLEKIQNETSEVLGRIIQGNGTVSNDLAEKAVYQYLRVAEKIRFFAIQHGEDLDSRLKSRLKARTIK